MQTDPTSSAGTSDPTKQSVEVFREACCGNGPLQIHVESMGREDTAYRVLYQPFALIGRDPRADLVLNHAEVNLRHAFLQQIAGRVYCVDLDSRQGTHWLQGVKQSDWLDYDQAVRIGPYWIRPYRAAGENAAPPNARADAWRNIPPVSLEFVNRPGPSSVWNMAPLLAFVGKSKNCRVRLVGPSVSIFHCSLLRTPFGLWVVDLFGRTGVGVNGTLVRCSRLDDGDELRVGKFLMRVHYESAPQLLRLPPPAETDEGSGLAFPSTAQAPLPHSTLPPAILAVFRPTDPEAMQPENPPNLVPAPAPNAASVEAVFAPLARQMGQMQQQMFDQFQQGMMMMFQMFNTLHRDQVGVIREELEHLHRLNEEVRTLQTELLARSLPAPAPAPRPAPAARNSTPAQARPPAKPLPQPQPLAVKAEAPPRREEAGGDSPALPTFEHPDSQMHVWLSQRLLSIQEERQSHWQKIVKFLTRNPGAGT